MDGFRKRCLTAFVVAVVAVFLIGGSGFSKNSSGIGSHDVNRIAASAEFGFEYIPGQVIVKFKDEICANQISSFADDVGIASVLNTLQREGAKEIHILQLMPDVSVTEAVSALAASSQVEYAEPNYIRRKHNSPNDPLFNEQWGLENNGQAIGSQEGIPGADIGIIEAWSIEEGFSNTPVVAVIDTGIDLNHPDLINKICEGYNYSGISQLSSNREIAIGHDSPGSPVSWAQSITGTGCDLTSLTLILKKSGNPADPLSIKVRDSLTGADLAVAEIAPQEVSTEDFSSVKKELSQPVMLENGKTYYLIFSTGMNTENFYHTIGNFEDDPYREGCVWVFDGTEWEAVEDADFVFFTNPNSVPHDDDGHGTHCAGIIGAQTNNAIGIAGACPGAVLMPLKSLSPGGGTSEAIASSIIYAADNGADIINMSLGSEEISELERDAVNYAYDKDVAIFASAGNSGDSTMHYPAGFENVIGVGATDNRDEIAEFSTHNTSVDISAPGVNIMSTMPTYDVEMTHVLSKNYDFSSGTSMACPMAAGLGALLISLNPSLKPDEIREIIQSNADDKGETEWNEYFGWGRINAYKTLKSATPKTTWYMAEGCTQDDFETWILVQNPNDETIAVDVTFMTRDGELSPQELQRVPIAPKSRMSFKANYYVSTYEVSTKVESYGGEIVCERAMYGNERNWAHSSIGTAYPSGTWFLPEGSTDGGMNTWILVQNPNMHPVLANITFMTSLGAVEGPQNVVIGGKSRMSFNANDYTADFNLSTKVEATDSVICERAVYGKAFTFSDKPEDCVEDKPANDSRKEGILWAHSSLGSTVSSNKWYMAEGSTAGGMGEQESLMDTWIIVQNPNSEPAYIDITFMTSTSPIEGPRNYEIPASSTRGFLANEYTNDYNVSTMVESDADIICERVVYGFDSNLWAQSSIGATEPSSKWHLAEGSTRNGMETWILVQNPNNVFVTVNLTLMSEEGELAPDELQNVIMAPNTRLSFPLHYYIDSYNVSTAVEASGGVICERAVYDGNRAWAHGSLGYAVD